MHLDNLNHNSSDSCTSKNDLNQSKSVQLHHDFEHDATTDCIHEIANSSDSESNYSLGKKQRPSASPSSSTLLSIVDVSTKLTIDATSSTSSAVAAATDSCAPSSSIPSTSQNGGGGGVGGGIRVKPIKNLFISGHGECVVDRSEQFRSEVHDVTAVKDLEVTTIIDDDGDEDDDNTADSVRDWLESNSQSKRCDNSVYITGYADGTDGNGDFIANQYLPSSLKFNKNSMSIYVKSATTDRKNRATEFSSTHIGGADDGENNQEYENIICSPNFAQVPYMHNNDDEDDDDDESETEATSITPAVTMQTQTMRRLKYMMTKNEASSHRRGPGSTTNSIHEYDTGQGNHVSQLIPYEMVNRQYNDHLNQSLNDNDDTKDDDDMLLMPMQSKRAPTPKRNRKLYGTADDLRNINFLKMYQAAAAVAANSSKQIKSDNGHAMNSNLVSPMRSAVVLRNPRGNQPRTYNTDALYAALMDVKSGESIYR